MAKRLFDLVVSGVALVLLAPVFLIAAASIRLSSPGPILFRAPRVGRGGTLFVMHKFRTMRQGSASGSPITGARDPRVFLAGRILRSLKIDELPQLYDVFAGRMSIVGPRPEDPRIVERHYTALGRETLTVLPGLASPGSIYNYTHGDTDLDTDDPEASYVANLLPIKLALELVYVRRATLAYDVRLILRTAVTIAQVAAGRRRFPDPSEMDEARRILEQGQMVVEAEAPLPVN